ncbi:MAG: ketopantoate [Desulfobulbaceae bacterium]|nr:MAG: ketopantoate [Desulfobulbaceae bacterium]
MRIAIAGPGALGCLLAALLAPRLADSGHSLWLLDHQQERARFLNTQGIFYETDGNQQQQKITVCSEPQAIGPVDILCLTVKSHDLESCLRFCHPVITPQTLLVFMQNGIGHLDIKERVILPTTPAFAVSSEGATLLAPGHVRHAGRGETRIGFSGHPGEQQQQLLRNLADLLREAGLIVSLPDDILTHLWAKLFVNVGINPLTALFNCTNGQLLISCAARGRLKKLVREAEAVARAGGINVNADPVQAALAVCKSTARNISSMLQDRRRKRLTEIEAINGAVVKEGKRVGIATPFNEEVVEQIKEMERNYGQERQDTRNTTRTATE